MQRALPSLAWVILDGVPRHVSEFRDVPRGRRPHTRCPHCNEPLILKLGDIRQHHAAHAEGSRCAATEPETALHLNCKLALATALRFAAGERAVLSIVQRCAGTTTEVCAETHTSAWCGAWDDVLVEYRVGNARRPDIVLLRDRRPIGGIEVVVSNPVSAEKARALDELGVRWIEVAATDALATPSGWSADEPLVVARSSSELAWRCETHARAHAAAQEARRHTSRLVAARVVDLYHDDGARDRMIYRVIEELVDGVPRALRLNRGGEEIVKRPLGSIDELRDAWRELQSAMRDDVARFSRSERSFADSPMRWAKHEAAANIVEEALLDRVGRDPTPLATRYPRRWFYSRDDRRWFLPADMRAVRWDRDAHDAFAEHPAWTRHRTFVRERPAPEGSWQTPVFSSRPIAELLRGHASRVTRVANDAVAIVELAGPATPRRAMVIVERPVSDEDIQMLHAALVADEVEALWVSLPSDWRPALAPLTWAPGGRNWRGHLGVVIDSLGVFRADQIATAWSKGEGVFTPSGIREHMAERVARLRADVSEP